MICCQRPATIAILWIPSFEWRVIVQPTACSPSNCASNKVSTMACPFGCLDCESAPSAIGALHQTRTNREGRANTLSCDMGPDFHPALHTIRDKMLMEPSANLVRSMSLSVASSVFLCNRNWGVMDVRALYNFTTARIVFMPEAMGTHVGTWRANSAARSNGSSMLRFKVLCTALVTMLSTIRAEVLSARFCCTGMACKNVTSRGGTVVPCSTANNTRATKANKYVPFTMAPSAPKPNADKLCSSVPGRNVLPGASAGATAKRPKSSKLECPSNCWSHTIASVTYIPPP